MNTEAKVITAIEAKSVKSVAFKIAGNSLAVAVQGANGEAVWLPSFNVNPVQLLQQERIAGQENPRFLRDWRKGIEYGKALEKLLALPESERFTFAVLDELGTPFFEMGEEKLARQRDQYKAKQKTKPVAEPIAEPIAQPIAEPITEPIAPPDIMEFCQSTLGFPLHNTEPPESEAEPEPVAETEPVAEPEPKAEPIPKSVFPELAFPVTEQAVARLPMPKMCIVKGKELSNLNKVRLYQLKPLLSAEGDEYMTGLVGRVKKLFSNDGENYCFLHAFSEKNHLEVLAIVKATTAGNELQYGDCSIRISPHMTKRDVKRALLNAIDKSNISDVKAKVQFFNDLQAWLAAKPN